MTIREAYLEGREHLAASGSNESGIEAELLLRHALGIDRARLYAQWESAMPNHARRRYRETLAERARGRPVHYIIGEREFMGLPFTVDERVLIPRPDTEVLVEHVLATLNGRERGNAGTLRLADARPGQARERESVDVSEPRTPNPEPRQLVLVDIGTGSGCIAVSLAHFLPQATVFATDISAPALEVAVLNAARHGVADRITFVQGSLLEPLPADLAGRVDAIVSNPPYVPPAQRDLLPREIRDHEPSVAIFAPETAMNFHHRLIAGSPAWLAPEGLLALEVGAGQAAEVVAAMRNDGRFDDVRVQSDYAGIARVVSGIRRP